MISISLPRVRSQCCVCSQSQAAAVANALAEARAVVPDEQVLEQREAVTDALTRQPSSPGDEDEEAEWAAAAVRIACPPVAPETCPPLTHKHCTDCAPARRRRRTQRHCFLCRLPRCGSRCRPQRQKRRCDSGGRRGHVWMHFCRGARSRWHCHDLQLVRHSPRIPPSAPPRSLPCPYAWWHELAQRAAG